MRGPAACLRGRPHRAPRRTAGAPGRRGAAHRGLSAVRGPRTGHRGRGAYYAAPPLQYPLAARRGGAGARAGRGAGVGRTRSA